MLNTDKIRSRYYWAYSTAKADGNISVFEEYAQDVAFLLLEVERLREASQIALTALVEVNSNYGEGMGVSNWHMNGDIEPLDNFISEWGTGEAIDALALVLDQGKK